MIDDKIIFIPGLRQGRHFGAYYFVFEKSLLFFANIELVKGYVRFSEHTKY